MICNSAKKSVEQKIHWKNEVFNKKTMGHFVQTQTLPSSGDAINVELGDTKIVNVKPNSWWKKLEI
jgi:hypothetical protein